MANLTLRGGYSVTELGGAIGGTATYGVSDPRAGTHTYKDVTLSNQELDSNFVALNLNKANVANPTFTGIVQIPNLGSISNLITTTSSIYNNYATNFKFVRDNFATINNATHTGTLTIPELGTTEFTNTGGAHDAKAVNVKFLEDNYAPINNPTLTGVPRSTYNPPSNDSSTIIANTQWVHAAVTPKANIASPTFTGNPKSVTAATNDNDTSIATTAWIQNEFGNLGDGTSSLRGHLIPTAATDQTSVPTGLFGATELRGYKRTQTGTTPQGAKIYEYSGTDLGGPSNYFANAYIAHIKTADGSIDIGEATLSATETGGIVLPTETAIGTQDNVLPSNLASSELDKAYASTARPSTLQMEFYYDGNGRFAGPTPIALVDSGNIRSISTGDFENPSRFIGFNTDSSITSGTTISVVISGLASGFTGLTSGDEYYINGIGSLSTTAGLGKVKVGRAVSTTQLFIYTTTTLDTYVTTTKKIGLDALSASNQSATSGSGGLSYDSNTGVFSFTPTRTINNADLTGTPTAPTAAAGTNTTQIANTAFVKTAIDNLVAAAPSTLDTLNEIAAAINDDPNFITSITDLINLRSPIASPTFTGTVTVPEPAAASNNQTVATTAFVKSTAPPLNNAALTGVPTAPTAAAHTETTQLATTEFVSVAVARGGGSSNLDGGLANSTRTLATHHFDGGNAN
mgnify:CR=1 FL=1|tara:strand:- start:12329 stop:14392 length:2064 start_codon:yes stop_codon:yes gene_type:complete